MSEYIVTARKWRPMKFEDVIGQTHVTGTLRNALNTNRLAHAYLFAGPRGVGKTTTARLLAKAVNCLHPVDNNPDNDCEICKEITEGRSFDVLEIDGASNRGVEEIRNLRESVRYAPAKGKYKVYIIDEVHMLTKEAFNALLKTLEEPPSHVLFIFATTEIHKLPATILSRCQRFDFRRISIEEIMANLRVIAKEEGLSLDDDALLLVARKGDGSLRDAQSLFDQVVSLCGENVTHAQILQALNLVDTEIFFRVTDLIKKKDPQGGLALVDELMSQGHDIKDFLAGLVEHFRNLLVAKTTGSTQLIEASDLYRKRYAGEAGNFTVADLLRLQKLVGGTESAIRWSAQPRFKLEADIVQMITMHRAPEIAELLARVEELKKKLGEERSTLPPPSVTRTRTAASTPHPTATPPPVHTEPSKGSAKLAEGEIVSRWQEFVGEVRSKRISLGSILASTTLLGVNGTSIRIGCSNDFEASTVTRNREVLAEITQKVFGVRARLEAEIQPGLRTNTGTTGESGEGGEQTPATEHPVIQAIIKELGAEPM